MFFFVKDNHVLATELDVVLYLEVAAPIDDVKDSEAGREEGAGNLVNPGRKDDAVLVTVYMVE